VTVLALLARDKTKKPQAQITAEKQGFFRSIRSDLLAFAVLGIVILVIVVAANLVP
jgi:hypothetical protein